MASALAASHAMLHKVVSLPENHRPRPRRAKPSMRRKFLSSVMRMVGAAPQEGVDIALSTVSLASSFDAYLYVSFVGAPSNAQASLVVDTGNTVLVVPRWEDIAVISNWQATYTVLGQASEPWGCPANVVRGPIQLFTETGEQFVINDCVFFACTANSPDGGARTGNFGAGCIQPWSASGWNTPSNIPLTVMSPLAYAADYQFAEFDFATADEVFNSSNPDGVSEQSTLRLYKTAPDGYQFMQVVANCAWMCLRPRQLQIAGAVTGWPAPGTPAIAMIDTGGTCVYLGDPTGIVSSAVWPGPVANPQWTSNSVSCVSTKASLQIELGDDQNASFNYGIDETALPASAQGLTLVMCKVNEYMRGQYGMNIGGVSALAIRIIIDYGSAKVGLRSLTS
jgi:hypothetical protein